MSNELRAKIFISCGQTENTIEEEVAKDIEDKLWDKGFNPYVACTHIGPDGPVEAIFRELMDSEYLIFIDFKRERLFREDNGEFNDIEKHRGSLFCNQELAIASFLKIPFIAFQQNGVKEMDGLAEYLQWNPIWFDAPKTLPGLILKKIDEENWKPNWKNQLRIERPDEKEYERARIRNPDGTLGPWARYYHLEVQNLNPFSQATNCYGYVEKIVELGDNREEIPRTIELKWGGYVLPNANILPSSKRALDAFYVVENNPYQLMFNVLTDSTYYQISITSFGDYEITFRVVADNFQPTVSRFRLHFPSRIDKITLSEIDD